MNFNMGVWFRIDTEEIGILTIEQGMLWMHVGDFDYHFSLMNAPIIYIGEL